MIKEGLKRSIIGIAYGGIISFIVLTFLMYFDIPVTASEIWFNMLLANVLGIFFGLSSLIFTETEMSSLHQTVIHYVLSIIFYFIIAYFGEWVPFTPLAIMVTTLLFTVIYALNWMGYYFYFKKVTENLNANLNRDVSKPE